MRVRSITRETYLASLRQAIQDRTPFASGKLGYSEQVWIASPCLIEMAQGDRKRETAIRSTRRFHAFDQCGVFPQDDDYIEAAGELFTELLPNMDALAVHQSALTDLIEDQFSLSTVSTDFELLEPNRSSPYQSEDCFLPALQGAKILLVTTPADLLAARATKDTFESVWSKIHCPWFYPERIASLSFPSILDPGSRKILPSSLQQLEQLKVEMSRTDFDVALIGASSMGIPLAHHAKALGKVGVSLGGHLQVLFGVQGKRWRDNVSWQHRYVTASWIEMPPIFKPDTDSWTVDDGAYW